MRADSRPWRGSQAPPERVWVEAHCWCPARPPVSAQPAAFLPGMFSLLFPGPPGYRPSPTERPQEKECNLLHIGTFWAAGPGSATDHLGAPNESDRSTLVTGTWTLLLPGHQLNSGFSTVLHKSSWSGFFHPTIDSRIGKIVSVKLFQDGFINVLMLCPSRGVCLAA